MQDKNLKIKPVPSKLFMYEKLYSDLNELNKFYESFSISEFACGASKLLDSINPSFYQGIDLREDLIEVSKNKFKKKNYDFLFGNMIDFKSKKKTNLGLCIQTFGINLDFKDEILIKCLNNLNSHIQENGSIIFNLSNELYLNNKKEIDDFCYNNYTEVKNINYGIFNDRYYYRLTRILIFFEKVFSLKLKYKKYVYIKCKKKILKVFND